MSAGLVFLDVNVLMYAAGTAHPHQEACRRVMQALAEGRLTAAIDTEIVQEILYRYGALRRWEIAVQMASDALALAVMVYPVMVDDIQLTVQMFERYAPQGITARDLIHAAVMQNNGLSEIVSIDSHFDHIDGLRRIDPHDFF